MRSNQEIINLISKEKEAQGMSLSELARQVGMAKSAVSAYLNGNRDFPLNRAQDFADALSIDCHFLLGMENNQATETLTKLYQQLEEDRQEKVLDLVQKEFQRQLSQENQEPVYTVKAVTKLAAGLGYAFNDYDYQTVQVSQEPPRYDLASIVSGDSMYPDYRNGDIVYLVDKGFSRYDGEVCAVAVNDKTFLKKVYLEKEQLRLVSINPDYDDIIIPFPPNEDDHIRIFTVIGRDSTISI
ncbi:LexA family transcriptional regulator [Streptococcus loxodontisalivarius]|uniref:Phage repressor protein C with HTH and peptisase S24 domain n=1 Tax=Streptococcus loxodontisalivarius TaxID=1349415 RepID=A0ABS2PNZ8_9STRE|nr:LexA family transcriptional regulator [Streptococcus loxodontisalivarius]MBM7641747.1 phage repressor protein C with HTH and peptisase S24 domain [Streptococcus loxodontisalivarius]